MANLSFYPPPPHLTLLSSPFVQIVQATYLFKGGIWNTIVCNAIFPHHHHHIFL